MTGFGYSERKQLAELRRMLKSTRRRIAPQGAVGSPAAPDNAQMMTARGQIAEIFDVRDADGVIHFVLGVTGMTNGVYVY